jgi:hypothetical protein
MKYNSLIVDRKQNMFFDRALTNKQLSKTKSAPYVKDNRCRVA